MNYEKYMKICIQLAKKGAGCVSPNPMVGCVVLDKNDNIVSKGYHHKLGANHAERDALLKIKSGTGHTLIVNLEPCSHYGKTPPCTDIIIEHGIKRVVIGMHDVNPKVSGTEVLKKAGIEVIEGVLEEDCKNLNEVFIKNMVDKRPFIAIKTASTLDGKIATVTGSSKWITSDKARHEVKKIRKRYDAIMTTSNTILADNPFMEHSKKIVIDRNLKTDFNSNIYKSGKIYVFHDKKLKQTDKDNIIFVPSPVKNGKIDLEFVIKKSYELGIYSILVEAGGHFNGQMLKFADKIYHFIAPKITGDNGALSCFDYRHISEICECKNFTIKSVNKFNQDLLITYYPIGI